MYEKRHEPVISFNRFLLRILINFLFATLFIFITLAIGFIGFSYFENMTPVNAFTNSAMTLADMGLITELQTTGGKVFAGFFSLCCGLVFFTAISIIFAPIIHRIMHVFHADR